MVIQFLIPSNINYKKLTKQYIYVFLVYALQFSYLLYQFKNQTAKYPSQNKSNWISMTLYQDAIYLVNNYSIYAGSFYNNHTIIGFLQQLPLNISYGQLYSTFDSIILLSQSTLIYKFHKSQLGLFQQTELTLQNPLNLFGQNQNLLISFNNQSIQMYQIKDYTVYNQNTTQSGMLQIQYSSQNGSQITESIYINVLPFFSFQIVPIIYQFNGSINQTANNIYYSKTDIKHYIGTNLTYSIINNTIKGSQIISQIALISQNSYNFQTVYALENLNLLFLIYQSSETEIVFSVQQPELSSLQLSDSSSSMWKQSISSSEYINQTIFIRQLDNTVICVLSTDKLLYIYEVQPLVSINYLYTINLAQILNQTSFSIQSSTVIENTVFIQILNATIIMQIDLSNYTIIQINYTIVNQVTHSQQRMNYVFIPSANQLDFYVWQHQQLVPIQSYTTPLNTYVFPLNCGVYVIEVFLTTYYLYFFDNSMMQSVNLGQVFKLEIDITTFQFKMLLSTNSDQFLYIYAKFNELNYINVYQCTDQQVNALYYQIQLEDIPYEYYLTATSNSQLGVDYFSIKVNSSFYLYMIPHKNQLYYFPDFQTNLSYNYETNLQINNILSIQSLNINTSVIQEFVQITSQFNTNINNNLTTGNLSINPYDYFGGAIQNYSISCPSCKSIGFQQIIANQQFNLTQSSQYSTSYIDDQIQYLYVGGVGNILQYTLNLSTNIDYSDISKYQKTITVTGAAADIDYIFLEVNTNAISWILVDKSQSYIVSYINETNTNISLPLMNLTIVSSNYYQGFLQIVTTNYYFCFNFQIINSTQQLVTLLSQQPVLQVQQFDASLIVLFTNQTYLKFGMVFSSTANTVQCMLLEIIQNNSNQGAYEILKYQHLDFSVLSQFELKFPIQNIQQLGNAFNIENFTYINLVYTNTIQAGTLQLIFDDLNLIAVEESCLLQMLNTSLQYGYTNQISVNGNQVAIFNMKTSKFDQQLLNLYYVDKNNCKANQVVQPYSFLIMNDDFLNPEQQINYLNGNQLLISYNSVTQVYLVNQSLVIQYETDANSTIQLMAQNPYSNQSSNFNIQFQPYVPPTPNNTTPNNTNNTTPNNTTPNNTTPNNTTPNNTTPNNTTPNNTTPNDTTPNNTTPNNTTPNNTTPNNTTPNNTAPNSTNNTTPNNTVPNDTTPDDQTSQHSIKWYWYVLISIIILIFVIVIVLCCKKKRSDSNNYNQFHDQEIEIKSKGLQL